MEGPSAVHPMEVEEEIHDARPVGRGVKDAPQEVLGAVHPMEVEEEVE